MLPAGAPERFRERSVLWNAAEKKATRKNSQTARSIDAALPRELSRDEQIDLVRNFVAQNFTSKGMCADFAIHDKGDGITASIIPPKYPDIIPSTVPRTKIMPTSMNVAVSEVRAP